MDKYLIARVTPAVSDMFRHVEDEKRFLRNRHAPQAEQISNQADQAMDRLTKEVRQLPTQVANAIVNQEPSFMVGAGMLGALEQLHRLFGWTHDHYEQRLDIAIKGAYGQVFKELGD